MDLSKRSIHSHRSQFRNLAFMFHLYVSHSKVAVSDPLNVTFISTTHSKVQSTAMNKLSAYAYNVSLFVLVTIVVTCLVDALIPVMGRDIAFFSIWSRSSGAIFSVIDQCGLGRMFIARIGVAIALTALAFLTSVWSRVPDARSGLNFSIVLTISLLACISFAGFVAVRYPFSDVETHACQAAMEDSAIHGNNF